MSQTVLRVAASGVITMPFGILGALLGGHNALLGAAIGWCTGAAIELLRQRFEKG